MSFKNKLNKFLWINCGSWEKTDHLPKWIKFPLTDNSNFVFYAKGKTFRYKIEVKFYKTQAQKTKIWRKKRG